jgi:hypothetical protein
MRRGLAAVALLMAWAVLPGSGSASAQGRAASFIRGQVFLEDQPQDASGTSVQVVSFSATLEGPSIWGLAPGLAGAGLLLLPRRRRAAALGLLLGVSGLALAALQDVSDASGNYELSPNGGGTFAPGWYRLRFTHTGYFSQDQLVAVGAGAPAVVTVQDVTLRPLPPPCTIFPADNPWNTDISAYPRHPNSDAYIGFINQGRTRLHPDFGTFYEGAPIGIPYIVVPASQPKVQVAFDYDDESDAGPYPIPPNPPIEGGANSDGDRHVLMLDLESCRLYELFYAWPPGVGENPYNNIWWAGSGAIFDLRSNELRPDGWTSADAAGLPILAGLVRYDEVVEQGVINHALRFTVRETQEGYIHPATHHASDIRTPNRPPMGLRLRMKPGYNCSGYSSEVQVICAALKKYGMFVADNGSDWFISGAHDPRWDDERLGDLKDIPGSAFEAVYTGEILR